MYHHFEGAGGEEDLVPFAPADASAPVANGPQIQPSLFGNLYQWILKPRIDAGQPAVFVHLGCGSGEGVIELWHESNNRVVCIGIDSDPALFHQAHIQNGNVEIVQPSDVDDLNLDRAQYYAEHIKNQADPHLLRPCLFSTPQLTSGTIGILLQHASVVFFNSSDDFVNPVARSRLIEICSAFCAVGTLLVSLDDMAAQLPQFQDDDVRFAWNHVSTLSPEAAVPPDATGVWHDLYYDYAAAHRPLYVYQHAFRLEHRVANHIRSNHSATISHLAISQVIDKCREQLLRGHPVMKRREVSGIAKTSISLILRILEQWDLLDVSSTKRRRRK